MNHKNLLKTLVLSLVVTTSAFAEDPIAGPIDPSRVKCTVHDGLGNANALQIRVDKTVVWETPSTDAGMFSGWKLPALQKFCDSENLRIADAVSKKVMIKVNIKSGYGKFIEITDQPTKESMSDQVKSLQAEKTAQDELIKKLNSQIAKEKKKKTPPTSVNNAKSDKKIPSARTNEKKEDHSQDDPAVKIGN